MRNEEFPTPIKDIINYENINYHILLQFNKEENNISLTINQENSSIQYEKLELNLQKLINFSKVFKMCESLNDAFTIFQNLFQSKKVGIQKITSNSIIIFLKVEILGKEQMLELSFEKEISKNESKLDTQEKNFFSKLRIIEENMTKLENEIQDIKNSKSISTNVIQEKKYDNGDLYIGTIYKNKKEGRGIMYYKNGEKYNGEWINDLKDGKGVYYYNNGNKYDGYFIGGKRNGKGIMFYQDGEKYDGEWKNDVFDGFGIYSYKNGKKYIGEFKNDKIHGRGTIYYNNGEKYEGNWEKDNRHGKGIFFYSNGDRFEGEWVNNKKEGIGRYYYKNGDMEEGKYKESEKIGIHKKYIIKYEIQEIKY